MKKLLFVLVAFAFLSACGGGEEGGKDGGNEEPKAEKPEPKAEKPAEMILKKFEENGKFGFKNGYGDDAPVVVEAKYDYAGYVKKDVPLTQIAMGEVAEPGKRPKEGKWGYIGPDGKVVVEPKYDRGEAMKGNAAEVGMKNEEGKYRFGAIDETGAEKLPLQYLNVNIGNSGVITVQDENRKWGLVDAASFEWLVEPKYDAMDRYEDEGLIWVGIGKGDLYGRLREGKYGYINLKGEVVIEPQFDMAGEFSEGMADVQNWKNSKWGYINTKGEVVIDYQFDSTKDFKDGKAEVEKGGKIFFIDKTGKEITE